MQNLPKCTKEVSKPSFMFDLSDLPNKKELINEIHELISADCWACVLDGEVLWNNYNHLNFKQKIYESMIRDYLIENTHHFIQENKPITRSEETHVLDIYMYSTNTILIKISIKNDQYHLNYFN